MFNIWRNNIFVTNVNVFVFVANKIALSHLNLNSVVICKFPQARGATSAIRNFQFLVLFILIVLLLLIISILFTLNQMLKSISMCFHIHIYIYRCSSLPITFSKISGLIRRLSFSILYFKTVNDTSFVMQNCDVL